MSDKFLLTRSERRGIVIFLLLLVIILSGFFWLLHSNNDRVITIPIDSTFFYERQQDDAMIKEWVYKNDSLLQVIEEERQRRKSWRDEPVNLHSFDPNLADSLELRSLGLPPWSVRGILQYRRHNGRFRQPSDVARIYNLSKEDFQRIQSYIVIHADSSQEEGINNVVTVVETSHPRVEKYEEGTQLNLNLADTTELMKIPGIGPIVARQICYWRGRLGGYTHLSQLAEIETFMKKEGKDISFRLDTLKLSPWFYVDMSAIKRIPVNRSSLSKLIQHPYINYYQAKAIVDYRRKVGRLTSLTPLRLLEEFTDEDINRMLPYLDFE